MHIYPGLVDAHSHLGLSCYGIRYEGEETNETNDIITPQLRAIDGINPAKHIGIDRNVGSIELGKEADLIITDGLLFDVINTKIEYVLINGKKVKI